MSCKKGYFIPVKVLSKRFRRLFLDGLKILHNENKLFPEGGNQALKKQKAFQKIIDTFYETDWITYAKKPFRNVNTVIEYLSRYTHRIAISNQRILMVKNDKVYFKYRDYKDNDKKKIMCLQAVEFIRRFLLHVLPFRFVKIRYFGFLSNRTRDKYVKLCRKIMGVIENIIKIKEYTGFADFLLDQFGFDVRKCPKCDGKLIIKDKLKPLPFVRAP